MVEQFRSSASRETYLTEGLYGNLSCGFPPEDSFHIFRDMDSAYPWPGLVFGLTLLATHYFCTNQVMYKTLVPIVLIRCDQKEYFNILKVGYCNGVNQQASTQTDKEYWYNYCWPICLDERRMSCESLPNALVT